MPFYVEFKQFCCYVEPHYVSGIKVPSLCSIAFITSVQVDFSVNRASKINNFENYFQYLVVSVVLLDLLGTAVIDKL